MELESSVEPETELDASGNRESTDVSSENDSVAESTPGENITPAEETPIIHVAAPPPADTKPAGAILPHVDAEPSLQEVLKSPEDFLKK